MAAWMFGLSQGGGASGRIGLGSSMGQERRWW
jgi:hypothetical protein